MNISQEDMVGTGAKLVFGYIESLLSMERSSASESPLPPVSCT